MSSQERRPGDLGENFREGVRTVAGILGALKDAVEESFDELRARGDLSPERAREAARATMQRAQEELDSVRDRLDFVSRREFDALRAEVDTLRARLDAHSHPHTHAQGGATQGGPAAGGGSPPGSGGTAGGFPVDGG
jgi:polyhydroxyalkanoate synthesis regulator phasin